MAQEIINNGESGLTVRTKLNNNFTDLYTADTVLEGDIQNINDNFAAATRGNVESMLIAGTNISFVYSGSGATRQLTISSSGGGGGLTQAQVLTRSLGC